MTEREISGWFTLANAGVEALKSAFAISIEDVQIPMVRAGCQMLAAAVDRIEKGLEQHTDNE